MSNFIETRGALARLLATENLVVQHNHEATTASFNVKDRVLTLPILKTESEFVYNMMTGHEVGHALYTPADWHDRVPENVPFDFVNVIEDVRIEKNIQAKFPGLRRDFTKGYDQLNDDDFFGIADKDLSKLSFIDRINLHFKLGARALVPFTDEEMTYVKAVDEPGFRAPCSDAAVAQTAFVDLQRQSERFHQGSAFGADRAVDLHAEAIAQLGMFLQVLLHRWIGHMGGEGRIVGVDLRPDEGLGVIRVLVEGVMQHPGLAGLYRRVGGCGELEIGVHAARHHMDAGQQHERR